MKNIVTITNTKPSILEFTLEIKGISDAKIAVRFIIEVDGMELGFDAVDKKKGKWEVEIPKLSILEKTMYSFHVDAVIDGYYFETMKGSINVVGSHEIYTTEPKNVTLAPKKKVKDDSTKTVVTTKQEQVVIKPEKTIKNPEKKIKQEAKKDPIIQKILKDILNTEKGSGDSTKTLNTKRKIKKEEEAVEERLIVSEAVEKIQENLGNSKDSVVRDILTVVEKEENTIVNNILFKKKDIIVH